VHPTQAIPTRRAKVPTTPLQDVLGPAIGTEDPAEIAQVVELLTQLAARFERTEKACSG
jgi:hypothetical protein